MGNPLVSFVVPAFNCGSFIKDAIERAFKQDYSPLEIVLSDDCSTDNTFEIMKDMARQYKGPHKILLNQNEKNLGITKHMNKLFLELAHGEIIVVAHGDDISEPNRTQVQVNYLMKHPDCMQVASSAIVCDSVMRPLSAYLQKQIQVKEERTYSLNTGGHVSMPSSAFRRKVMEFFGPMNDDCPTEDDPVGFRALLLGKIALIPDILIHYRKHEGSMSNPKKFIQFPLDKIYEQNLIDMTKCLKDGRISRNEFDEVKERLYEGKERRKVYRQYFANRTFNSLWKLLTYPKMTLRLRLAYIRQHIEYMLGHHE